MKLCLTGGSRQQPDRTVGYKLVVSVFHVSFTFHMSCINKLLFLTLFSSTSCL